MSWIWYLLAFGLGGAVGAGEVVSKYRDSPRHLFSIFSSYLYVVINGAASATALAVVRAFDWKFGIHGGHGAVEWVRVVIAGVASMAVLRSSLANVRVRGADVSIGLQAFLDALLSASDRAVDRAGAERRDEQVAEIMKDLDFHKVRTILPQYCFQLLQNSNPEDETGVANAARKIASDDELPDAVKTRMLGLQIMTVVGPDVLRRAVTGLRPHLLAEVVPPAVSERVRVYADLAAGQYGIKMPTLDLLEPQTTTGENENDENDEGTGSELGRR